MGGSVHDFVQSRDRVTGTRHHVHDCFGHAIGRPEPVACHCRQAVGPEAPSQEARRKKPVWIPGTLKASKIRILEKTDYKCAFCGLDFLQSPETLASATLDHVRPRALRGSDKESNLVAACQACNLAKGARHAESVVEVRPLVLAERRKRLNNLVNQMADRGIEFGKPLDPPEHDVRVQLEAVALLLVQQADGLFDTLARLERLTETEVERVVLSGTVVASCEV